jgi:hypothetical protein
VLVVFDVLCSSAMARTVPDETARHLDVNCEFPGS